MKSRCSLVLVFAMASALHAQFKPIVSVTAPTNGAIVSPGFVTLRADASAPGGAIDRVVFYVDGIADESSSTPPYETTIYVTSGRHNVRAMAYDTVGYFTLSPRIYFQVGGGIPVNLIRGPYLQSCTATSIIVRWRTDWPTNSVVCFGVNSTAEFAVTNHVWTNEHIVQVTSLQPGTSYYYTIGNSSGAFGTSVEQRFRTAPTNDRPVNVWVLGDSGTGPNNGAEGVRDAFLENYNVLNLDLWLMLGDNAYEVGSDDEYQTAVFEMYPGILPSLPLYPAIGNHDGERDGGVAILDIFSPPQNGQAGGWPSGTKNFYSFDYANVHFVCLDSFISSRLPGSAMLTWLEQDLAATEKDWIIAYWHHPPYSFGSHNSDTELEMVQMRQNVLPILEWYGADLVLAGHNHFYDRSMFVQGHYGVASSFTTNHILDPSLGRAPAPYRKPAGGLGAHLGTVYVVCGNSGQGGPGPGTQLHPTTAIKTNGTGFMILQVDGQRLDARFVDSSGATFDSFTIDKSASAITRPRLALTRTWNTVELSWPTSTPAFTLEMTTALTAEPVWQSFTGAVRKVGRRHVAQLAATGGSTFFRLKSP